MDIIQAIILGIIEGITEFLPVSSTFHLILGAKLLGLQQTEFVNVFIVCIQAGAIGAAALLLWKDLLFNRELLLKVGVGFIPTGIIGFVLHDIIKGVFFESEYVMLAGFVLMGIVFIIVELLVDRGTIQLEADVTKLTYKHAFIAGIVQALAIVPGVSRAGSVIIGMMVLGYKRTEAAVFSFMLALPTIFTASLYDAYKMRETIMAQSENLGFIGIGLLVSFITAYVVMKWFLQFLKTNTLIPFALYRFVVAGIIMIGGLL